MIPSTCPAKQISGGQREEGHGVVDHNQGEHHQTSFLVISLLNEWIL